MNDKLVVGIADMKMAQGSGMLVTYAPGSCIGICFYDPMLKLAALLHIMLPLNLETGRKSPLKYADTGIRETLREMERRGAKRARVTAKIAGGARMFEPTPLRSPRNPRPRRRRPRRVLRPPLRAIPLRRRCPAASSNSR